MQVPLEYGTLLRLERAPGPGWPVGPQVKQIQVVYLGTVICPECHQEVYDTISNASGHPYLLESFPKEDGVYLRHQHRRRRR